MTGVILFLSAFGIAFALALSGPSRSQTPQTVSPTLSTYWARTSGTPSMEPGLIGQVDICVSPEVYRHHAPERYDVIVFQSPDDTSQYLKRVVALPGETVVISRGIMAVIAEGNRAVLEEPYLGANARDHTEVDGFSSDDAWMCSIPAGHVFVLGDNRRNSRDSRDFGPIPITSILGKVIYPSLSARTYREF
ncbi:MAG: signal peptidase I [Planctomycetaceae bacterium]|nr:signal peptidase I [Planctomycetaceae bacterium]